MFGTTFFNAMTTTWNPREQIIDYSPCDSPIEDIFYYEFQKVRADKLRILRQFECPTPLAIYRLDFFVEINTRRVGFECDGRDYHEEERDSARDTAIIKAGWVDRIYRIRGRDIFRHIPVAFDIIQERDPTLFSERGRKNIKAAVRHCHKVSGYSLNQYRDDESRDGVWRMFERDDSDGRIEIDDMTVIRWTDRK